MRLHLRIALLFAAFCSLSLVGQAIAGLFVSITVAPPALPVYVQPPVPGPGYIWTPGYWAWDGDAGDYYWVPGAWVLAPQPGLLWTPGYWGWDDGGVYVWHAGYWGPHIGFYGGINYGFGYTGVGFAGGYWSGGVFLYNRAVMNVGTNVNVTNVYDKTVIVNNTTTNVSFNGGSGGTTAQPTAQELQAAHEQHVQPTVEQMHHQQLASQNKDLRASVNHGRPAVAAVGRAGDFSKSNIVPAKAAGSPFNATARANGNATMGKGTPNLNRTLPHERQGYNSPMQPGHNMNTPLLHGPSRTTQLPRVPGRPTQPPRVPGRTQLPHPTGRTPPPHPAKEPPHS